VRRFTHWARYEPDAGYRKGPPTSLPYLRHFINDHKIPGQPPVERADLEYELDKIADQGGAHLYGMYNSLLEYAADRAYLRGYLLNREDQPATADEIARSRRIASPSETREALADLEEIGLLERVPLEEVQRELRLAKAALAGADRVPVDRSAEGEPSRQGAPKEGRPPDTAATREDGVESARDDARPAPEGNSNPNSNSNGNRPAGAGKHPPSASLAGGGQAGKQKQKTQPAIGPCHEGAEGDGPEREPGHNPPAEADENRNPPADADQNGNASPAHADQNGNDPPRAGTRDPHPPRHETGPRARDRASSGPTPSGSDGARGARVGPPATEGTSRNVHPGQESGRGWRPPGADELPTSIDRLTEAEWIDNTGLGWHDVRYELGKATKFGQLIAWAIGVGVGRAAQDEIQAFAARWDEILAAPIDEGYRIWLAEKLYALAVELNERRMKELRQGRTDPPNYRKIWMAEAKRGLQAAAVAEAKGVGP
jgi:hypothetical protein